MRRIIRETFPLHGIVGEEFGPHAPDAEYVWVLDPIDGTKSFISGIPLWGTLIGLTHRGVPAFGMTLSDLTIGKHVTGPNLTQKDLKGKVVFVVYWGTH